MHIGVIIIFIYILYYLTYCLNFFYTLTGATVMDTQDLVKSLGGTLIVPVTMRGKYRGTAVSSVLIQASSRRSLYVTTHAAVTALELMEIHQSAKVYVYQRPYSSSL